MHNVGEVPRSWLQYQSIKSLRSVSRKRSFYG